MKAKSKAMELVLGGCYRVTNLIVASVDDSDDNAILRPGIVFSVGAVNKGEHGSRYVSYTVRVDGCKHPLNVGEGDLVSTVEAVPNLTPSKGKVTIRPFVDD